MNFIRKPLWNMFRYYDGYNPLDRDTCKLREIKGHSMSTLGWKNYMLAYYKKIKLLLGYSLYYNLSLLV